MLQVSRRVINKSLIMLLYIISCTNAIAQGKEIFEKEITHIDSCLAVGIESIKDVETVSALCLFGNISMRNLREDVWDIGKININLLEYEEFKKDYQNNKVHYVHTVDSFISSFFIPHSIVNLDCESITEFDIKYEYGFYLHKMDHRLEPHVFDFKQICLFHLERIKNGLNDKTSYAFTNNGDCLFVEVVEILSDSHYMLYDPISPRIEMEGYKKLESWCMKYIDNPDLDILFFDAISDCVRFVEIFGYKYKNNVRKSVLWNRTFFRPSYLNAKYLRKSIGL